MAEQFEPTKGLHRNQVSFNNYSRKQYPLMTSYQYNNLCANNSNNAGDRFQNNAPLSNDVTCDTNYYYAEKICNTGGPPSSTVYPKQRFAPYQCRYNGHQSNQQQQLDNGTNSSYLYYNNYDCGSNQNEYELKTYNSQTELVTEGFECNFFQSSLSRRNENGAIKSNGTNNSNNLLKFGSNGNLSTMSTISNSTANLNSTITSNVAIDTSSNCEDNQTVTLSISNLGGSYDENTLRYNLLQQLKPITPVISINAEGSNTIRVKVPSKQFAKLVVSHLHRKKFGHKRMVVSYMRNSSTTEFAKLRCQVAGLLKDVPFYTLSINTFRELFQSRFKQSINIIDLFRMQDICIINCSDEKEKIIALHPDLINSLNNNNPLVECLELSVPYCTIHFRKEKHKGWAEQDIEPLPNVVMSLNKLKQILLTILNIHKGDIPILSIMHCIEAELKIQIKSDDQGVNLEHLISCITECQITNNQFGIKVLRMVKEDSNNNGVGLGNFNKENYNDPLHHISHEIVELIKLSPKATLKFDKFIPAYHNHFGKQCRVADYGYTKLIDLFEALAMVVQVIGDGENRLITLTHRTQLRRFTNDLLRILKTQANRSILLSKLPHLFSQFHNRIFDVSDYGVCDLLDILDGLVHNNTIITTVCNNQDILISIPKRQQTQAELEKMNIFAEEVIELLKNAPQYAILFQKFVRSYHYNFGYQCRLSDYGFYKLSDLMESINGIIEIDSNSDENRKVYLSPKVAQRVFSEQIFELSSISSNVNKECVTRRPKMKLNQILEAHKNKYGYQIQSNNLGYRTMIDAIKALPYIELVQMNNDMWVICHHEDPVFRTNCYAASTVVVRYHRDHMPFTAFRHHYPVQPSELIRNSITSMNYFIQLKYCPIIKDEIIKLTPLMKLLIEIINLIHGSEAIKVNDLKRQLNIQMGSCFEYGFPNISSLISSFSDIFIINDTEINNFEIKLNPDNFLTTWINSQPNQSFNFIHDEMPHQILSESILGLSTSSGNSVESSFIDLNNYNNLINESYLKGHKSELVESTSSKSAKIKLDKTIDQPTTSSVSDSSNIYKRRNVSKDYELNISNKSKSSEEEVQFCDALDYARLLSLFYEPPKPDTPPSKIVPFWLDPVWSFQKPWSPDINMCHISKIIDGNL